MGVYKPVHGVPIGHMAGKSAGSTSRAMPCARCGLRAKRRASTSLCSDCAWSLSKEERAIWNRRG